MKRTSVFLMVMVAGWLTGAVSAQVEDFVPVSNEIDVFALPEGQ